MVILDEHIDTKIRHEQIKLKSIIDTYSGDTPYYVYQLCDRAGMPFYVGKGKRFRALAHIKESIKSTQKTRKHIKILSMLSTGEFPSIEIVYGNLSNDIAYELEEKLISEYKLQQDGGILLNILPGGLLQVDGDICSHAGEIGGYTTKINSSGIFSPNYDRSAETKRRWEAGIISEKSFSNYDRSIGGKACVDQQKGIFSPDWDRLAHSKQQWQSKTEDERTALVEHLRRISILGAEKSKELKLNFSGMDKDHQKEIASMGGKVAGKIPMWTNGSVNKRSYTCPGIGWFEGITKKHKITKEIVVYKFDRSENEFIG